MSVAKSISMKENSELGRTTVEKELIIDRWKVKDGRESQLRRGGKSSQGRSRTCLGNGAVKGDLLVTRMDKKKRNDVTKVRLERNEVVGEDGEDRGGLRN